jgi:hypothetical protein
MFQKAQPGKLTLKTCPVTRDPLGKTLMLRLVSLPSLFYFTVTLCGLSWPPVPRACNSIFDGEVFRKTVPSGSLLAAQPTK